MKVAQLAIQLGLALSQISKMETGVQKVSAELLPAWCEAVGITLAVVFRILCHFFTISKKEMT
ncbi:helix-turn-helix domain-containing protein, partial [Microbulbifer sp. OS29]